MELERPLYWKLIAACGRTPGPHDICPAIADYVIDLAVQAPDNERPRFMPFMNRLTGTRDGKAERKRADHIVVQSVRRILPLATIHWPSIAQKSREATTADAARRIAVDAQKDLDRACKSAAARGDRPISLVLSAEGAASAIARSKFGLAAAYAAKIAWPAHVWAQAFAILDEAILLGRHDETGEPHITQQDREEAARLETAKKAIESDAWALMRGTISDPPRH
jgi:hypothetical protein